MKTEELCVYQNINSGSILIGWCQKIFVNILWIPACFSEHFWQLLTMPGGVAYFGKPMIAFMGFLGYIQGGDIHFYAQFDDLKHMPVSNT